MDEKFARRSLLNGWKKAVNSTALSDAMKEFQLENTTYFRFSDDMFGPKDLIISSNSEKQKILAVSYIIIEVNCSAYKRRLNAMKYPGSS